MDPTTNHCIGTCKTRFRVCLKHYQAHIDTTSPCTFGDVSTSVVGENSMNLTALSQQQHSGFVNPIRFPFHFTWPVSKHKQKNIFFLWFYDSTHFSLIVSFAFDQKMNFIIIIIISCAWAYTLHCREITYDQSFDKFWGNRTNRVIECK